MKVLIITSTFPPQHTGSGKLMFEVCKQMKKEHSVDFDILNITSRSKEEDYSIDGINVYCKYIANTNYLAKAVVQFFHVYYFLRANFKQYDLVHCLTVSWMTLFSAFIAKRTNLPIIMESTLLGDVSPEQGRIPKVIYDFKEAVKKYFYRKVDIYKVYSQALKQEIESVNINKPINIISAPVNTDLFTPVNKEEKNRYRGELGYLPDDKLILFVGALSERKGVRLLVDSFVQLAADYPKLKLILIGPVDASSADYLLQIEQSIRENALSDRVTMTKKAVNNIDVFMKCSDIFVLPSKREGFGAVTVEAMSCGVPTIVTNLPGISEHQIDHGKSGFILYEKNSKKLTETIKSILNMDHDSLNALKTNARKKVVREFSLKNVAKQTLDLYEQLEMS